MPSNLEQIIASDDGSLFSDDDLDVQEPYAASGGATQTPYFSNPNKRVSQSVYVVYLMIWTPRPALPTPHGTTVPDLVSTGPRTFAPSQHDTHLDVTTAAQGHSGVNSGPSGVGHLCITGSGDTAKGRRR